MKLVLNFLSFEAYSLSLCDAWVPFFWCLFPLFSVDLTILGYVFFVCIGSYECRSQLIRVGCLLQLSTSITILVFWWVIITQASVLSSTMATKKFSIFYLPANYMVITILILRWILCSFWFISAAIVSRCFFGLLSATELCHNDCSVVKTMEESDWAKRVRVAPWFSSYEPHSRVLLWRE